MVIINTGIATSLICQQQKKDCSRSQLTELKKHFFGPAENNLNNNEDFCKDNFLLW